MNQIAEIVTEHALELSNSNEYVVTPQPQIISAPTPHSVAKRAIFERMRNLRQIAKADPRELPALKQQEEYGIPDRYSEASREGRQTSALAVVRDYRPAQGQCLILSGMTGVGKTYAAVAVLRAVSRRSKRFFSFPALCGSLLDYEKRTDAIRQAKETWFVVFDDFGGEYHKEGGLIVTLVDEILCHREGYRLPTIITTNLGWDEIKARNSDRVVSRLSGEWGVRVLVEGPDLRLDVAI